MATCEMLGGAATDEHPGGTAAGPSPSGAAEPTATLPNGKAPCAAELPGGLIELKAGTPAAGKHAGWAGGCCGAPRTCACVAVVPLPVPPCQPCPSNARPACLKHPPARTCVRTGECAGDEPASPDTAAPAAASPSRGAGAGGGLLSAHGSGASCSTHFHSPAQAADAVQAMRATLAALHRRMHQQQAAQAAAATLGAEQHQERAGGDGGTPGGRADSPAPAAAATITAEELESLHTCVPLPGPQLLQPCACCAGCHVLL